MPAKVVDGEKAVTSDGVSTKPLYIKHLALGDWEAIKRVQAALGGASVADAIRFSVRKAAGLGQ